MRINKLKFVRNILICILALGVVSYILDMAPGFKRDKYKDITNIIVGDENLTEKLKNPIYISENGSIFLSKEDTSNLLNSNIYIENEYEKVIIICDTKVGAITLEDKVLTINGSKKDMLEGIVIKDEITYLPISEMTLIFNIEISYIKETDVVMIDKLNRGIIKADVSEDTIIKYKPRALSKEVGKIEQGEKVSCFYTTSKGWRLIRTNKGILRICKSKYSR